MTVRAVVFDIGGVLEVTPPTGWIERWEARLQLQPGGLQEKMHDAWRAGSLGTISLAELERRTGELLSLDTVQVTALMDDIWEEYLGTLNGELTDYFACLRSRYRTAILSNSFVGAREKEQERYRFGDLCDLIIYSHEVGLAKPDPRIFALTCARLNVQPAEMIFVDDGGDNIIAARQLGIQAIRFESTQQAIADIEARLHAATATARPAMYDGSA